MEKYYICILPLDADGRVCQYQGPRKGYLRLYDDVLVEREAIEYALCYVVNSNQRKFAQLCGDMSEASTTTLLYVPPLLLHAPSPQQRQAGLAARRVRATAARGGRGTRGGARGGRSGATAATASRRGRGGAPRE